MATENAATRGDVWGGVAISIVFSILLVLLLIHHVVKANDWCYNFGDGVRRCVVIESRPLK